MYGIISILSFPTISICYSLRFRPKQAIQRRNNDKSEFPWERFDDCVIYFFDHMGNVCCNEPIQLSNELQEATPVEVKMLKQESNHSNSHDFDSKLDTSIQKIINLKSKSLVDSEPFHQELQNAKNTFVRKSFTNGNMYVGQLDELERPHGMGKLLKNDGSIIIGHFKNGAFNGSLFYVNPSGLICSGEAVNGILDCKAGILETPKAKYSGGFRNNLFSGDGVQNTEKSKFEGAYESGKRKQGRLSWSTDEYIYLYEGKFDENQEFTGIGRLVEPFGEYKGQFLHGEKHGQGKYTFASQLVYEGQYTHGQREGKGKLINKDGSLSYEGDFQKGLPHGIGKSYRSGAIFQQGKFFEGIYESFL